MILSNVCLCVFVHCLNLFVKKNLVGSNFLLSRYSLAIGTSDAFGKSNFFLNTGFLKLNFGSGIIEPLPLPLEKPVIKQNPRNKGGMVQRNPYPYNPRPI